jgi:hypothetical protein
VGIKDSTNVWTRGQHPRKDKPNLDHPWTKKILRAMPQFVPKVMFRLCEENCHLTPVKKSPVVRKPPSLASVIRRHYRDNSSLYVTAPACL